MDFYTIQLGFTAVLDGAPDFAHLELGDLRLLLNGPASSAARPTPLGRPAPGGWNRIQLVVDDLASKVAALRCAGHAPVDEVTVGRGGSQVLLRDPSGNLIELFAPAAS